MAGRIRPGSDEAVGSNGQPLLAQVTRLHVGASASSEGFQMAVESFGARYGIELLERMGNGSAVWFRRGSRLVLVRQTGVVAGAADIDLLVETPLADVFADVRRLGGPLQVPGFLPDGTSWTVRFVPLPEGAVAAIWLEARPTTAPTAVAGLDQRVARRLMSLASEVGKLADGTPAAKERAAVVRRAIDREAWRLVGLSGIQLPVDPKQGTLASKLSPLFSRLSASLPARIQLLWEVDGAELPVDVPAPGVRFVIEELLRNAVAAIGEREGRVRVRAGSLVMAETSEWSGERLVAGRYAYIEMTDDGCGMDSARLADLVAGALPGSFASLRGLARGWGGGIRVRTAEGRGTIVQIAVSDASAKQSVDAADPDRPVSLVFLAPATPRDQIVAALDGAGMRAIACSDEVEVLAQFRGCAGQGGVSLLVVGETVGGADGFEVARRLREMAPVLPVLLLTDRPAEALEQDLPDLAPGRVVPLRLAVRAIPVAARNFLPTLGAKRETTPV